MDEITKQLRRKVISSLIKNYVSKNPLAMEDFFATSKAMRQQNKNKWAEWEGDDMVVSHMADFPEDLWKQIESVIGFTPRFLGTFDERAWFAREFPKFMMRDGKGALTRDKKAEHVLRPGSD